MTNVAVVTDTSADLTPEQVEALSIRQVPLTVSFGDESFEAGTELTNEEFFRRLSADGAPFPRTAAPSPARFERTYREALDGGASGVVCITLSKELSATWTHAVSGARDLDDGLVEVVDSRSTTVAQGLLVRAAAEAAADGASVVEIAERVRELRARSKLYFGLETLEYLQRGGRIGRASALVGSLLSVKPILTVVDGSVEAADRRRTTSKARARIIELCSARPVERAIVLHTMTPGIEAFADELAVAIGMERDRLEIGVTGPVAGTHVGPGCYGAALIWAP